MSTPIHTPDQALEILTKGNARFANDCPKHPRQDAEHIAALAYEGQRPLAAVVGCSDSRVPVERLFDQGVGDLFVIRTAGHVMGEYAVASAEYAVHNLEVPLVVILGHTGCGAVTAALKGTEGAKGSLPALLEAIQPAINIARHACPSCQPDELVSEAVEAHVMLVMQGLYDTSEEIREAVTQGRIKLLGGIYHLSSGLVEWLDPQF